MSKTAKGDVLDFPTFDATAATDQIRAFAEKGVEQTKEAYARLKSGAEEAQKTLETTFETMRASGADLSLKSIAAMRANADATFSHLEALAGVKSVSEFFEIQTSYLRKSMELGLSQAKDMQAASTKAFEDLGQPVKTAFEKAVKELKVA